MSKSIVNKVMLLKNMKLLNTVSVRPMATSTLTNRVAEKEQKIKKEPEISLKSLLKEHESLIAKKKDKVDYEGIKFYDPPYLNKEAAFPNYELLNINVKGYDYSVLDTYYRYIERLCVSLKIDVVEAYAMPCRTYKIKTYQPFSATLDKEFKLNHYHRVVRISNLKSTFASLLFETIQLNLPEGVQMNVSVPSEEDDEFRYVPDIELNELKQKLTESAKKK